MPLLRSRPLLLISLLILALPAALACAGLPPLDQAAAQARPPAQALADARRLAGAGHVEEAAQAYSDALVDGGDTGVTARVELAALLDRTGSETLAAGLIAGLLAQPPTSDVVIRAWFIQGSVQSDLGNRDTAIAAWTRYMELGGPATPYARVELARDLQAAGRDDPSAPLTPLLSGAGPAHARRLALKLAGQIEEGADRPERALPHYEALLALTTWNSERIVALDRIGALRHRLGDLDGAAEAWRTLVTRYPSAPEAAAALTALDESGRPADGLTAGLVHYRRGNNEAAREQFNAYLRENGAAGPGAATALFYLGALAERRGDEPLRLENYTEAYAADPAGRLAPDSLYERALALEDAGQVSEAAATLGQVAERFPSSGFASEAAFRRGFISYRAGDRAAARGAWTAAMGGANAAGAARAAFWAGRTAAELGDAGAAQAAYGEAVRRDPTGYYGLRAAAVLAGQPRAPALGRGVLTPPVPDWAQAEAWLAAWAGPEDPRAWQTVTESEDWRSAKEMLALGWVRTGADAAELVIDGRNGQPWVLYRLARELEAAGQPHLAFTAVGRLLAAAPASAPPPVGALTRLAYPVPWADEVQYYADQNNLDPLLIYALMRQESAFDPRAGSSAGAFGLTQFIEGTAADVARALGKTPFAFADLERPHLAIQFGAYYLSAQLKGFGGNLYQALAAYNGGGGNATRWARPGGADDLDRFYEEIDFTETRSYLRLVLQNYAWYRYLYGAATRPTLTRG